MAPAYDAGIAIRPFGLCLFGEVSMRSLASSRRYGLFFISMGSLLMMVALFLHPMRPEDFLALAFSWPQEVFLGAEGTRAAILFWVSLLLQAAGGIGCLMAFAAARRLRRRARAASHPAHSVYQDGNREDAERSWSFM